MTSLDVCKMKVNYWNKQVFTHNNKIIINYRNMECSVLKKERGFVLFCWSILEKCELLRSCLCRCAACVCPITIWILVVCGSMQILAVISWLNSDLFIHRCASSGRYVRAYPAGGCSKRTEESSRTTCKSKQSIM